MAKIKVIDRNGTAHDIDGKEGYTLMEAIRDAGLPIEAACGGCASCATCHVYVDNAWLSATGEREDLETDMLDLALEVQDNSRLSCQVSIDESLDGLVVTLAPE